MTKINVKLDEKAKNVVAKTLNLGGEGGSSLIEVPANSRITLNGNKLLQLLIAKGVDVDAEVSEGGILLGCAISFEDYLSESVNPNMLDISYGAGKYVSWSLGNGMNAHAQIEGSITFKSMLKTIGALDITAHHSGVRLFPYVALQTSSVGINAKPVDITTEEFLSFISITPLTE